MPRANRHYIPGYVWHTPVKSASHFTGQVTHRRHKKDVFKFRRYHCDRKWTESIAVGSESFVKMMKELFGADGRGRKVIEREDVFELREDTTPYNGILGHENAVLSLPNMYLWECFN